jgi:hypothetical protein
VRSEIRVCPTQARNGSPAEITRTARYAHGVTARLDLLFGDWSERASARARSLFVPTVSVVAVADLFDLANGDEAVRQLYDWERDRLFTLAKGLGAAAVGVVTTLLVDAAETKSTNSPSVWLAAAFAIMLLLWGGFILTGLRRLAEEYPVALKLLHTGGRS